MKKLISLLIVFATVISLCACGGNPANTDTSVATGASSDSTEGATEPTVLDITLPEVQFGHINQLEPVNGVYKIWSEVGVQNIANHPDGKFEVLCNIDMQGATIPTIGTADKPFTGEINGVNCTISNFTIKGGEEGAFGFVAVNQGEVKNLMLENVSFQVDDNAQYIGAFAGINEGTITRCTITGGAIEVKNAPENANCGGMAGKNTGELSVNVADVDLVYRASSKACIGGIAGVNISGELEYNECHGSLDIAGSKPTVGLYAGVAENVEFLGCWFMGETNSVDGVLFTNYVGSEKDVVYSNCLWRDNDVEPLPENVRKLRDTVVAKMYEMGTVEWHVNETLTHNCKCGTSGVCVGSYTPGTTYYGLPYKHGSGSLTSFLYCLDEDGAFKDWLYDMDNFNGYDVYIGSMCVSATEMAWWTVSNTANHIECEFMLPDTPEYGCIPVGEGWWENATLSGNRYTKEYHDQTTKEVFFKALAEIRAGDCLVTRHKDGDHVIMAATDAVIVRDQEGNISDQSFFLTHEQQGSALIDQEKNTYTTWRLNYKRTFDSIWTAGKSGYIPVTCEELLTGEMETPECAMLDSADGQMGMTVGTVKGNYFLEAVTLKITDSKGQTVMDKMMFPKAGKPKDANTRLTSLSYIDSYDMAHFCTPLQNLQLEKGETYSYTVTAKLATGDEFMVKEDSFVYGTAG